MAKFELANVIRQYNGVARRGRRTQFQPPRDRTAVGDGQPHRRRRPISVMYAEYHYLFWRPVTAIRTPTAASRTASGRARVRRPQPGHRRGSRVAAAPDHAQPPRYPAPTAR